MSTIFGRWRRRFIAVLVAAGAALTGVASVAQADDPPPVAPQIIGGNPPTQNYPAGAKVSLQYDASAHGRLAWHTCGAALTDGRHVRTAAHCVTDPPAGIGEQQRSRLAEVFHLDVKTLLIPTVDKSFFVRVGSDNRHDGIVANARVKWVHPQWSWAVNPGEVDDIAILELDHYIDVYALPLAPRAARPGDQVFQLGWGSTLATGDNPLPINIHELRTTVIGPARCTDALITTRDVCVANALGTGGVCYGDSGGPLLITLRGVWYDAGIVSRMASPVCGATPAVYTSTPEFRTEVYDVLRTPASATHTRR